MVDGVQDLKIYCVILELRFLLYLKYFPKLNVYPKISANTSTRGKSALLFKIL